jgi:16S rRNA processing protein RimM
VFSDQPLGLKRYGTLHAGANGPSFTVQGVRAQGPLIIARFAEVKDRTAADQMRGIQLWVPRAALPPVDDAHYQADLIGLAVRLPDGSAAGTVTGIENYGAGDLLEIERSDGKRLLVPYRDVAVPTVDVAGGFVVIEPGFLAD